MDRGSTDSELQNSQQFYVLCRNSAKINDKMLPGNFNQFDKEYSDAFLYRTKHVPFHKWSKYLTIYCRHQVKTMVLTPIQYEIYSANQCRKKWLYTLTKSLPSTMMHFKYRTSIALCREMVKEWSCLAVFTSTVAE